MDRVRKAKADLELNLAKDVKGNRKGFYKYINSKRKTRENMDLLLNGAAELVANEMPKAKVLSAFFASVFTSKTGLQEAQTPQTRGTVQPGEENAQGGTYQCV